VKEFVVMVHNNGSLHQQRGPATGSFGSAPIPIPYSKVAILGLILAANNTSIWMIFSFLPFMVQHFFPYLTKAELGYHAGLLGSAFSLGSLFGNIIWGVFSDKLGRRSAMLMGLFGTG
jgi:MFS family permease